MAGGSSGGGGNSGGCGSNSSGGRGASGGKGLGGGGGNSGGASGNGSSSGGGNGSSSSAPAVAYSGPSRGQVPNVWWRALELDELRGQRRFVGLPPPAQLQLSGPQSYRYVRQDSDEWVAAHAGVLTTGSVQAALGMLEPGAASKAIGTPRYSVGHGAMLAVYRNLQQPAGHALPHASCARAADDAKQHNKAAVEAYNRTRAPHRVPQEAAPLPLPPHPHPQQHQQAAAAVHVAAATAAEGEGEGEAAVGAGGNKATRKTKKKKKKRGSGKGAEAASAQQALPLGSGFGGPTPICREDHLRARCRSLAQAGLVSVRCAWGSAQEASTLRCLLGLLPGTVLHEAGLCLVSPAVLQASYGYGPGTLPPLGASPDAFIEYASGAEAAAAAAVGMVVSVAAGPTARGAGQGAAPGCAICACWPTAAAVSTDAATAVPGARTRKASSGQQRQGAGVEVAVGSSGPSGAGRSGGQRRPQQRQGVAGGGGGGGEEEEEEALRRLLQDIDMYSLASPAAASSSSSANCQGGVKGSSSSGCPPRLRGFSPAEGGHLAGPGQQQQQQQPPTSGGTGAAPTPGPPASSAGGGGFSGGCGCVFATGLEVVELKNTPPFAAEQRVTSGGKVRREYLVSDSGPAQQVRPYWVPQLQLHMLASGAASALLVSRSATKGVSVFRVARDEQYISDMLAVLSHLYCRHVLPRVPPPLSPYSRLPAHQRLLSRTREVARAAQVVGMYPNAHVHAPATDMRLMFD